MEGTTLITFMLYHPTARKIELLGSWDNFSEPYAMERDRRRGKGIWQGCHTIRNIICDGDDLGIHESRPQGLKMGGTYWYFYRVDDDEEFFDPDQEITNACPLMPGQTLNVLDVPLDVGRFGGHSRSSSMVSLLNIMKTMNPQDRYVNPKPVPKLGQGGSVAQGMVKALHILRSKVGISFPFVSGLIGQRTNSTTADATTRYLPHASEQIRQRVPSRRRARSASFSDRYPGQDHTRHCSKRLGQSAPASPTITHAQYHETFVSLQHACTDEAFPQSQSPRYDGWPVRDQSIGGGRLLSCGLDSADNKTAPPTAMDFDFDDILSSYDDDIMTHTLHNAPAIKSDELFISMEEVSPLVMPPSLLCPRRPPPPPPPPPESLLPHLHYSQPSSNDMQQALQVLHDEYTISQQYSPWRSEVNIPLPDSPEHAAHSHAPSSVFSYMLGDASDTTASHRHSNFNERPLKINAFGDFGTDIDESSQHLTQSCEQLSIHTIETATTADTIIPVYRPPSISSFEVAEIRAALKDRHVEKTPMEQLLDEFEYLGAALL